MRYLLIFGVTVLVGCSSGHFSSEAFGATETVQGVVAHIDTSAAPVDGETILTIETERGPVEVLVPSGEARCAAREATLLGEIVIGDRVEVVGTIVGPNELRPCTEAGHAIRRVGD